ncbi:MAG: homoserine kinase [Rhodoferax sp.]
MAVYTEVSFDEASELLRRLNLGEVTALRGIEGGIENTNYFASTERDGQPADYVLTLFERLTAAQLPFYLHLMKHLAQHGLPVPDPAADQDGDIVHSVQGKPASVVNRLRGHSELEPTPAHCAAVGTTLAHMHLAARDFALHQPNLRGLAWWNQTVPVVLPHLSESQAALIRSELAYQNHVAASPSYTALPRGPVHADLFRDNVMFEGGTLTGVFDFYFAGVDTWLFDLAVCLNDWCIDRATGAHQAAHANSLLTAYAAVRPLARAERQLLPAMLRAGALRFWISRLWDQHLPREATILKAHDPSHFERVLRERVRHPVTL